MSLTDSFRGRMSAHTNDAIEQAKADWQRAENYFNHAPQEMAEYAVLRLATASKRYEYLLKKSKHSE